MLIFCIRNQVQLSCIGDISLPCHVLECHFLGEGAFWGVYSNTFCAWGVMTVKLDRKAVFITQYVGSENAQRHPISGGENGLMS
jgi:hypothetical protein